MRHRARRHPLYLNGESKIVESCNDNTETQKRLVSQWLSFCIWSITQSESVYEVANAVTREYVIRYGKFLKSEFDRGRFASTSTAVGYLSGINSVMKMIHDEWELVSPVADCGLSPVSHIPNKKPELDKNGLPNAESLAGYLLELQITLGVTVREALILDLKAALTEGRSTGFVTVTSHQNGMRRKVPCRPAAITAIGSGIAARRLQRDLPKKWEFDDFLAAHGKLASRKGYSTNTARGDYVRERYKELTGVESPILSGLSQPDHWRAIAHHSNRVLSEAKGIDKNSRHQIAKEIGVLGLESIKEYLDKKP